MKSTITLLIAIAACLHPARAEWSKSQSADFVLGLTSAYVKVMETYETRSEVTYAEVREVARFEVVKLLDIHEPEASDATVEKVTDDVMEVSMTGLREKGIKVTESEGFTAYQPPPTRGPIGADTLYRKYQQNAIAADARYRGNQCLVVETVYDIGRDIMGAPYVIIGSDSHVQAMFTEEDEPEIAKLRKGQPVAVIGEVRGQVIIHVVLQDCVFTDIPPEPTRKAKAVAKSEPEVRRATPAAATRRAPEPEVRRAIPVKPPLPPSKGDI